MSTQSTFLFNVFSAVSSPFASTTKITFLTLPHALLVNFLFAEIQVNRALKKATIGNSILIESSVPARLIFVNAFSRLVHESEYRIKEANKVTRSRYNERIHWVISMP